MQELPKKFGRYNIFHRLGSGGMGSVYLAEDTRLKRKVAIKVTHMGGRENRQVIERFYREAEAAAALNHPYLCKVFDVGEIDDIHYLVMEYIEGTTLADFIAKRKDLPQREMAGLVVKLALGLQEAHAKGVVHRDLKPPNVMLKKAGLKAPVIVDFGLAQMMSTEGMPSSPKGPRMGTPSYMAIEQVQSDWNAIGPPCDIYALGVILYKLLTGEVPFRGPNTVVVITQILSTEAAPPSALRPDLDPALETICLKAMAKQIKDRYASMADFAAALTAYLDGSFTNPGDADAEPELPRPRRARRTAARVPISGTSGEPFGARARRRVAVGIAATFGLLLLGAVGYTTYVWNLERSTTVSTSIGIRLRLIPAGEFLMGSPDADKTAAKDEKPQHKVEITRPFYLGACEVTQGQYYAVMGRNPSSFRGPDNLAVDKVTWEDAVEFCARLTKAERESGKLPSGWEYRLPTEAQWEYACRAGSTGKYSFGDDLSQFSSYSWYDANVTYKPRLVGRKRRNAFGLYDMYGNVSEWCQDWFGRYPATSEYDPTGPATGSGRVRRNGIGGSAERAFGSTARPYVGLGFRIARVSSGKGGLKK